MVVYHCASIGVPTFPELKIITNRMQFVHFAFIIISGYLCGWYYFPKISKRCIEIKIRVRYRALKLLLIFLTSNLLLYSVDIAYSFSILKYEIKSVTDILKNFVLSMNGSYVAFEILFYISAFLFLTSFLLGNHFKRNISIAIVICGVASVYSSTLLFICCGLIGALIGIIVVNKEKKNILLRYRKCYIFPPIALILYQWFFTDIMSYINEFPNFKPIVYCIESVLYFQSFLILISVFSRKFDKHIILLGKYTLYGYLVQMAIIRLLYIVLMNAEFEKFSYYIMIVTMSSVSLSFVILLTHYIRKKSQFFDSLYCLAFQ